MHDQYTMLMSVVLDQEATVEEELRLREHLATCEACGVTWDRWRALDRKFANAPVLVPSAGFAERVVARLGERRRQSSWKKWLGSGVILLWGILFCGFWFAMVGLALWGLSHPLEVALILSTAARLVSGVSWLLRSFGTVFGSVGLVPAFAGVGLTGCLAALWVWVMIRSRAWIRAAATIATGESV